MVGKDMRRKKKRVIFSFLTAENWVFSAKKRVFVVLCRYFEENLYLYELRKQRTKEWAKI